MNDNRIKLGASGEILGAMLSAEATSSELKADAKGYIMSHYNIDLTSVNIVIAENDASTVHLALPYYTSVEEMSANALADSDTEGATGAEIFIAIGVTTALAALGGTFVAAGVGAAVASGGNK